MAAIPSNFPITGLSTTWKLLSAIVAAEMMSDHMGQYMWGTKKEFSKDTRDAKNQLLVERAVTIIKLL